MAVCQLALNTAAAAASTAQAQIVAEQQAANLREADTSRQLQSSTEALVRFLPKVCCCCCDLSVRRFFVLKSEAVLPPFLNLPLTNDHCTTADCFSLGRKGHFCDDLSNRSKEDRGVNVLA